MRINHFLVSLAAMASMSLTPTFAQQTNILGDAPQTDKKIFNHLDASITMGSTGLGIDLAMPIGEIVQVRTGFTFFPHYEQTMHFDVLVGEETDKKVQKEKFNKLSAMLKDMMGFEVDRTIDMKGKPTMKNFKLLVDVFPFRNKHWHVTGGVFIGPSTIATAENATYDATSLVSVAVYNQLYDKIIYSYENDEPYMNMGGTDLYASEELYNKFVKYGKMTMHVGNFNDTNEPYRMVPDANNMVSAKIKVNRVRPYLGFGYGGRLFKRNDTYKVSFDCGAMFWGGTPNVITHDGTNLAKDVHDINGKVGRYTRFFKALKVYPVLELRLTRKIF